MKVGKVEGTPEEIKGLFDNNGLNLAEYISASQSILNPKRHGIFLVILIICFVAINCCLWIFDWPVSIDKLLIVIDFTVLAVIVFLIHQRFDKILLSAFTVLVGLTIMGVCLGYMTPKEALKKLEKIVEDLENGGRAPGR